MHSGRRSRDIPPHTRARTLPARGGSPQPGVLAALALIAAATLAPGPAAARPDELAVPVQVIAGPDPGVRFLAPGGVAIDSVRGELLFAEGGRHRVSAFDLQGTPLGSFVHMVPGPDGASVEGTPAWVAVNAAGEVLLSDRRSPDLDVLDYRGHLLGRLRLPAAARDPLRGGGAGAIAVRGDGAVLVATRGDSGSITEFDPEGAVRRTWGEPGLGEGRLSGITGIACAPDGRVIVTCARTHFAVQIFDSNGVFIHGFGVHDIGPGNFSLPSGVAVTADGRIWVSDEIRQLVQVFAPDGALVGGLGSGGLAPGEFQYPSALATDGRTWLVVAERVGQRLQIMRITDSTDSRDPKGGT